MSAKSHYPAGLPPEIAVPLLGASARLAELKPWEFMSDLHLVGVRDETTRELHVASVLGAMRQVFGVVFYRGALGLRYIHRMALEPGTPDPDVVLEALDYLQIEWTNKKELRKTDHETLANAAYKPSGRGPVWPKFSSCQPGWFPWFPSESEARQLTDFMAKINRFARLFEANPALFEDHMPGEVPIVPAGSEDSLRLEDLDWFPLIPEPLPTPEALVLSAEERTNFQALPIKSQNIFEVSVQLMPEMSFYDEKAKRPACGRVGLICDRNSFLILGSRVGHGAAPLRLVAGEVLTRGLLSAKARPAAIHVDSETMLEVLRPAGESIGVPVLLVESLPAANDAMEKLAGHRR